jgi:hypothetical protein
LLTDRDFLLLIVETGQSTSSTLLGFLCISIIIIVLLSLSFQNLLVKQQLARDNSYLQRETGRETERESIYRMTSWSYSPSDPKDAFIIVSIISCSLSLLVIITFLIFHRLRNKLFMKIITLISVCDFIANICQIDGVPSHRDLCILQGLIQQFFYPASWLWTVILTYLLYSLVAHGKISLAEWKMHLIVWGICTAITVLPLTTSTYGTEDNDDYFCWIRPSSNSHGDRLNAAIWSYLLFDLILVTCFGLMILWGCLIFYKLSVQLIPKTDTMESALRTLLRYPIALFITWFPNLFYMTVFPNSKADQTAWIAIYCLSTMQGGITALLFFMSSRESRFLWWTLFTRICVTCCGCRERPNKNDLESSLLSETDLGSVLEDEDFESDDVYYGRISHNRDLEPLQRYPALDTEVR